MVLATGFSANLLARESLKSKVSNRPSSPVGPVSLEQSLSVKVTFQFLFRVYFIAVTLPYHPRSLSSIVIALNLVVVT